MQIHSSLSRIPGFQGAAALLFGLGLCVSGGVSAQPEVDAINTPVDADYALRSRSEAQRRVLENALRGYLVALPAGSRNEQVHVGVPLWTLPQTSSMVSYDLGGSGLMTRWRLSDAALLGWRLQSDAFVGTSGTASLVLSTHF